MLKVNSRASLRPFGVGEGLECEGFLLRIFYIDLSWFESIMGFVLMAILTNIRTGMVGGRSLQTALYIH